MSPSGPENRSETHMPADDEAAALTLLLDVAKSDPARRAAAPTSCWLGGMPRRAEASISRTLGT